MLHVCFGIPIFYKFETSLQKEKADKYWQVLKNRENTLFVL